MTAQDRTTTPAPAPQSDSLDRRPSLIKIGLARGVVEVKQFFREKQAWIFTLAFPALLLLLFGTVFQGVMGGGQISVGQYFLPAMMAFGVMSTSFTNLAVGIAVERDDGTLKRLRGAPMPPTAFFLGKIILVVVAGLAEIALMLLIGVVLFDVDLALSPQRWVTFVWVMLLGMTCFAMLGIGVSNLAGSGRNAGAVVNLPFILLQFVSGVFLPYRQLPESVQLVGAIFPAKWFAQGLRSVFLPDSFLAAAPYDAWQHGLTALVMGAWCVGGLVLCLTTFRWTRGN